jgi:hypothetical protein
MAPRAPSRTRIFGTQLAHFSFPVCNKRGPFARYEPELTRSSVIPDNLYTLIPFTVIYCYFLFLLIILSSMGMGSAPPRTVLLLLVTCSYSRRQLHAATFTLQHVSSKSGHSYTMRSLPHPAKSLTERPTTLPCVRNNRLTDMELPNAAVSNTGPLALSSILRGELVGPSKQRLSPCLPSHSPHSTPAQPIEL